MNSANQKDLREAVDKVFPALFKKHCEKVGDHWCNEDALRELAAESFAYDLASSLAALPSAEPKGPYCVDMSLMIERCHELAWAVFADKRIAPELRDRAGGLFGTLEMHGPAYAAAHGLEWKPRQLLAPSPSPSPSERGPSPAAMEAAKEIENYIRCLGDGPSAEGHVAAIIDRKFPREEDGGTRPADETSLLTSAERLHQAISVMYKDWKDGDFALPPLARHHMGNVYEKYLEVGKALKFGEESFARFQASVERAALQDSREGSK